MTRKPSDIVWWALVLLIVCVCLTAFMVTEYRELSVIQQGATASRTILCDSLLFDEQQPKVKALAEAMVKRNCYGIILPNITKSNIPK